MLSAMILTFYIDNETYSMIKDFMKRPTPEQIMEHPFIVESSIRTPEDVNMRAWIRDVWDYADSATEPTPQAI
jgi:hypothetical protein